MKWRTATLASVRAENAGARTLVFDVADWPGHVAGQRVDVRLTATDGYTATRSYSLASASGGPVELTVVETPGGEVSPFLVRGLAVGGQLEIRGPVGGWFVWPTAERGRVQLIGGGSGVVPLVAMLRTRHAQGDEAPMRLLYSVRAPEAMLYADELADLTEGDGGLWIQWSRETPPGWKGKPGRLDPANIRSAVWPPSKMATTYVCGPSSFVTYVSDVLIGLGYEPASIRTERFGGLAPQ